MHVPSWLLIPLYSNPEKFMSFTLEEIEEAMNDQGGFCTNCGASCACCEPDARNYPCEECGEMSVFGAEELVVMGRVK